MNGNVVSGMSNASAERAGHTKKSTLIANKNKPVTKTSPPFAAVETAICFIQKKPENRAFGCRYTGSSLATRYI